MGRRVKAKPARTSPDFEVLDVANTVLGGGFLSRLNLNLREQKGWSYGAKAELGSAPLIGELGIGSAVQTDKTADAMREIDREIRELGTSRPPSPQEITVAKNAMLLGLSSSLQSPTGAYALYYDAYRFNFAADYWNKYVPTIQALTPEAIGQAASRLYRSNELTWFVVGDLSKIEAGVRKLNLGEVMVYNSDGTRSR
ncbi:insulinase family protein [Sphingomonas suaedae]|uniref:Insulinase family protein n=1 Tax=Sphingomonas suaedae TaxID=2599297 RepID=A0A518RHK6_9SPHN|nr:insulinase family protein [Sphingomonas suaedae]QDX26914.1 insulinase family protein [Sphingomonas suaedae]